MAIQDDRYNDLAFYTLAHPDPAFIHQHVVDAYTAQQADDTTKPIAVIFALIGLYLHLEKHFTGRQVQRAHMQLAKWPNTWPKLPISTRRSEIDIEDVLAAEPGAVRDAMIDQWCESVWNCWRENRPAVVAIAQKYLEIG
jgi:hypothetical protein